jgi:FkbM family methyltransferase
MAKLFKELVRRTVLSGYENLVALDDVYLAIRHLMRHVEVTGLLDAGASDGRVTAKLLRCFPKAQAYAFEPNPAYADAWRRRCAEDSRMHVAHVALADEAGTLKLHVTRDAGPSSLFKPSARFRREYPEVSALDHVEEIPVVRLDDWRAVNGNPSMQFMKFDIQAAELKALRGAVKTLEATLAVYTEIFFNPMYEGGAIYSEIDLFLREHGFCLYNIYKPRATRDGMLDQANAIFVRPEILSGASPAERDSQTQE